MSFKTPVVLIVYNRPEQTKRVLSAIREIHPEHLFVIADGGKNAADGMLCNDVRALIDDSVKGITIHKNYSEVNLGCAGRIITGLDWVFENVEKAIILEDDCLPDPSFFNYCEDLLTHYKDDDSVMHISGCNLLQNVKADSSYVFSNHILPPWGWATWRRAWKNYNPGMNSWQKNKERIHPFISRENFKVWTDLFEYIRLNKVTWDVSWNTDIWAKKGLGIIPSVNLVKNIGLGDQATFTRSGQSKFSDLKAEKMNFPLVHPQNKETHHDPLFENAFIQLLKEINEGKGA